mmetsp:Transcript_23274/g.49590  ORF Transcript_23274/g.49590 Transcript_23274/m.49590 type:complete len:92 (-) Transcript_23274:1204-1479(-)
MFRLITVPAATSTLSPSKALEAVAFAAEAPLALPLHALLGMHLQFPKEPLDGARESRKQLVPTKCERGGLKTGLQGEARGLQVQRSGNLSL